MKIKNRVISLFLSVVLFASVFAVFPPIEVGAAEIIDDIPKLTSPSVGTLKYLSSTSKYAYAKESITPESNFKLRWNDVTDYYTVYVKALDNDPNPGDAEDGELLYNKQSSDGFSNNYLTISKSNLEDCVGKYIKVSIQGKNSNGDNTVRCDYYIYVDEEPEIEEPKAGFNFSSFWYSEKIELGENLEWGGVVDVDNDDWDIVDVSISVKHPNGSAVYYRATDIWDWYYKTQKIQEGSIPTNTIAPEGQHPNNSGGYYKVDDFIIDEPGIYELYVNMYAKNGTLEDFESKKYEFEVLPSSIPEILDISVSSNPVSVAEEFTITVKTNASAHGVVLYCDNENWEIGKRTNKASSNIYTFTYKFEKTNKTDLDGYDVTNTRKIFAYPYDSAGNIVTASESMGDYNIIVNPAEYTFSDFEVHDCVTVIGNSVTITWESVSAQNGATVYYNLWIDNEIVAENLTSNSYVLSEAQVQKLGVGAYGIMVMVSAEQCRMKQSIGGLTIKADPNVNVYPGDVNGDGRTDAIDVTKLKKYLANYDETNPAKQSYVNPIGADVNGDGKINGKDLSALYVKLENENIKPPEPEPEPDIPSTLPVVKHTYTVNVPLDKADLKATTGRTIYLMPKYGYVKLVAYDETGKEVKLSQAGITIDISNANGIVTFDGFTLKAVKGGYGVISYTQAVNGKKTTTEIAIHVGEASASSSKWPSSYQYTKDDYEYVSICLDLLYSLNSADVPNYNELEMGLGDTILEGMGDWKDRLSNILQNEWNFETQIIKESIALFIDYYADELESIVKENNEIAKKDADNITDLLEEIYRASDEVDKSIGGVVDLIGAISDMRETQVTIEKIARLQAQVEWMYENGTLKKMFDSSPRLKAYQVSKEISLRQLTEKLSNTKKISGRLDIDVVGVGLDFFKGIVYISNDYSNNIKLLEMLKKQIVSEVDANSPEMEAIVELIDEYNNKALTAMDEFLASLVINGFESTILKHPAFAIFDLATLIVNEINHTEEKTNLRNLIFYHTAIGGVIDNASLKMYSEGVFSTTLDDIKFASNIYLYLLIFENEIALTAVDKENVEKVNAEIAEIKSMFEHYLNYCILTSV